VSLNEPRIFTPKPSWLGLEEIGRDELTVTFRTKTGTKTVMLRDVEAEERKGEK